MGLEVATQEKDIDIVAHLVGVRFKFAQGERQKEAADIYVSTEIDGEVNTVHECLKLLEKVIDGNDPRKLPK